VALAVGSFFTSVASGIVVGGWSKLILVETDVGSAATGLVGVELKGGGVFTFGGGGIWGLGAL